MTVPPFTLGSRIDYRGERGFVRYIGAVTGKNGTWIGIEWDNVKRGAHDGSHNGHRYFQTAHPTGASLVKATHVKTGGRQTLVQAVQQRYCTNMHTSSRVVDVNVDEHRKESSVGWIGNTRGDIVYKVDDVAATTIKTIDVSAQGVYDLGDMTLLHDASKLGIDLRSVRTLRLAQSLFHDFSVVHQLLTELPQLEFLDISRNTFCSSSFNITTTTTTTTTAECALRELILNGCNIPWHAIAKMCARSPSLIRLRAFNNGLQTVTCKAEASAQARNDDSGITKVAPLLKLLDLGGNRIPHTQVRACLAKLPQLEELYLGENKLGNELVLERNDGFPKLNTLSISGNKIDKWQVICGLAHCKKLDTLFIANTPLTADEDAAMMTDTPNVNYKVEKESLTSRMGIIARLGSVKRLNGTAVLQDERMHAEKLYLKNEILPALRAGKLEECAANARFREVCEKYDVHMEAFAQGKVDRGGERETRSGNASLRNTLVEMVVRYRENASDVKGKVCVEKVPVSIRPNKIRGIVRRAFDVHIEKELKVTLRIDGKSVLLDDAHGCLQEYGVRPAQKIVVIVM